MAVSETSASFHCYDGFSIDDSFCKSTQKAREDLSCEKDPGHATNQRFIVYLVIFNPIICRPHNFN